MANKYSQIINTPYVSTYAPAPLNEMTNLAREAFSLRSQAELEDARNEALLASVVPETAEEEQYLMDVLNESKKSFNNPDEPLAQRAIRSRVAATKAASKIQALQNARQARRNYIENFRNTNKNVNPTELSFREQFIPGLSFANGAVAFNEQEAPQQLAEDVEIAKEFNDTLRGVASDQGFDIDTSIDPITGKLKITNNQGVSEERLLSMANQIFESSPKMQDYIARRAEYHTMVAEGQGSDALEQLIDTASTESTPAIAYEINQMRKMNPNISDAEIYGQLMANQELTSAMGFVSDKYAFNRTSVDFTTPMVQKAKDDAEPVQEQLIHTPAAINPAALAAPSTVNKEDIIKTKDSRKGSFRVSDPTGNFLGNEPEVPGETPDIILDNTTETLDPEKFRTKEVKAKYGDGLYSIVSENPQEEGETQGEYLDRIISMYEDKAEYLSSIYTYSNKPIGIEENKELKGRLIGLEGQNGILGDIQQASIVEISEKGDGKVRSFTEIADMLGYNLSNKEDRELFINATNVLGTFRGTDPFLGSGAIISTYDYETTNILKRLSPFHKGKENVLRTFKVSDIDQKKIVSNEQKRQLSNLAVSPIDYDPVKVNIKDSKGKPLELEFSAKDSYIRGEDGRMIYGGKILSVSYDNETYQYDPNSSDSPFNQIIGYIYGSKSGLPR